MVNLSENKSAQIQTFWNERNEFLTWKRSLGTFIKRKKTKELVYERKKRSKNLPLMDINTTNRTKNEVDEGRRWQNWAARKKAETLKLVPPQRVSKTTERERERVKMLIPYGLYPYYSYSLRKLGRERRRRIEEKDSFSHQDS